MSGARKVAGLDTLDSSDQALLNEMRQAGDGDPSADRTPEPAPAERAAAPDDRSDEATLPPLEESGQADDTPPPAEEDRARTVPHQALHQERLLRQKAQQEAKEAREEIARSQAKFEERLRMLAEATVAAVKPADPGPAAPPPIEIPDVNTDPVGHLNARLELANRTIEELKAVQTGDQQARQQFQEQQEIQNWGRAQEQSWTSADPRGQHYGEAMKFLRESRHAELESIGINDPAQRELIIGNDVRGIAAMARRDNGVFPERLYKAAVARGFKEPAAGTAAAQSGTAPTLPPLDPGAAGNPEVRRQAARENTVTIGAASGAAPARAMTPTDVANMDEATFSRYVAKLNPSQMRDLLGH